MKATVSTGWTGDGRHTAGLVRTMILVCVMALMLLLTSAALGSGGLAHAHSFASEFAANSSPLASSTRAPEQLLDWVQWRKTNPTVPPPGKGFTMPPYTIGESAIPVYPPQGATWRRNGVLALYKVTDPLQGSEPGPVRWAVTVWQELLQEAGYPVPQHGHFDQATAEGLRRWQVDHLFEPTGELTMAHARALLGQTIRREADAAGIPAPILCGHLTAESVLDPAAIGANGVDLGIAQISVPYHRDMTEEEFFDEDFAIRYMAQRNAAAYRRYKDWNIAVVSYNSPVRAKQWADTGQPSELAARYAQRVMLGCGPLDEQITVTNQRTLADVALHFLGDPQRQWRLSELNNVAVDSPLTPGQTIKLPKP